jgi:hypothetical protein
VEVVAMFGVMAIVLAAIAYVKGATVRKLRNATSFAIGELREGQAGRVIGDAFPFGETLQAPLTGRACIYFIATVEQYVGNRTVTGWKEIVKEERGVPFVLTDGTGRAIVDPTGAEIALDFDNRSTPGTFDDPSPAEEAFIARHKKQRRGLVFNKKLRYREAVIHVGERVAVLGEGIREPDPEAAPAGDYRGEPPTRLRLTSTPRFPLVISDAPDATRPKP